MKLSYLLLDVFTREPLKGNPLAVVCKAEGLLDDEMQAIAREFNLSETVFLCKPHAERNSASVRIFTPVRELDFAGHPTVGAAVVLGLQNKLSAVRIEENVGLITALVERLDKNVGAARFSLPRLPEQTGELENTRLVAQALGVAEEDIGCGPYRPALYSAGTEFHLVPVRDGAVLRRIQPNTTVWPEIFGRAHGAVYAFTVTPEEANNDFAARMFAPGLGVGEDPGTGAAASALIGLLARHAAFESGQADYVLRQGHEMGRPCRITMQMRKSDGVLSHGAIGGEAVIVGEGSLDLGKGAV